MLKPEPPAVGASGALDTLVTAEVQVADYDGLRPGDGE